MEREGTTLRRV